MSWAQVAGQYISGVAYHWYSGDGWDQLDRLQDQTTESFGLEDVGWCREQEPNITKCNVKMQVTVRTTVSIAFVAY